MMGKKDYIAATTTIAARVSACDDGSHDRREAKWLQRELTQAFSSFFRADNPRFDEQRFAEAVAKACEDE